MPKFFNKKILIISLIVLPLFILVGSTVYLLQNQKQIKSTLPKTEASEQEKIISQQLKELDELKQRAGVQPLTEKEKQAQIKELGTLYKQSGIKPLSKAEIQKQLEELDKLRLAQ